MSDFTVVMFIDVTFFNPTVIRLPPPTSDFTVVMFIIVMLIGVMFSAPPRGDQTPSSHE